MNGPVAGCSYSRLRVSVAARPESAVVIAGARKALTPSPELHSELLFLQFPERLVFGHCALLPV